ncbi:MAG: 3-dehydroquinate synthase [Phenylobacterium zucineum]|nr:MAG: 3-dehydroquinate synthase [Phenylobacterium zucineum]
MIRTVPVQLAGRAYEVMIGHGLMAEAGRQIHPFLNRDRVAIVTDEVVWGLHGGALTRALEGQGVRADVIVLPPGEQTKSFAFLEQVSDRLLALALDRGDLVVAFGGGVIGDLTGFAASIYKRGIDFIQIPTTLLAQVDSSVGGKTAIDTPRGKNLIGAFHQPRLVLADLDLLSTLPAREVRAGYAEVIKYGLLGDLGFFEWLEIHGPSVLACEPSALLHAVARSVEMKAEIVALDEKEGGPRALLNLGHTFGHALESETGFGEALLHGEAVAAGSAMAFRYSAIQGFCTSQDAGRAEAAIRAAGLPTRLSEVSATPFKAEALCHHMAQDKKAEGGRLTFILAKALGAAFVAKDVSKSSILDFLKREGAI